MVLLLLIQMTQDWFTPRATISLFIFSNFQPDSKVLCSPRKVWMVWWFIFAMLIDISILSTTCIIINA